MESIYTKKTSDKTEYIERVDSNGQIWSIPIDEANSDYKAYLESLKDAAN